MTITIISVKWSNASEETQEQHLPPLFVCLLLPLTDASPRLEKGHTRYMHRLYCILLFSWPKICFKPFQECGPGPQINTLLQVLWRRVTWSSGQEITKSRSHSLHSPLCLPSLAPQSGSQPPSSSTGRRRRWMPSNGRCWPANVSCPILLTCVSHAWLLCARSDPPNLVIKLSNAHIQTCAGLWTSRQPVAKSS